MLCVENWASTCTNHTSRSVGQNGGIFTETADTEAGGYGSWAARGGEEEGSGIFSAIILIIHIIVHCKFYTCKYMCVGHKEGMPRGIPNALQLRDD